LDVIVKREYIRGSLKSVLEHRLGKMSHRGKEDHGNKLGRRHCGKTDGEAWLSNDSPIVEIS
jgi:hypothetical protein